MTIFLEGEIMKEMLDWIVSGGAIIAIIVFVINIMLIAAIFATAIHCSYIRKQTLEMQNGIEILQHKQEELYDVQYSLGRQNKQIIELLQKIERNTCRTEQIPTACSPQQPERRYQYENSQQRQNNQQYDNSQQHQIIPQYQGPAY